MFRQAGFDAANRLYDLLPDSAVSPCSRAVVLFSSFFVYVCFLLYSSSSILSSSQSQSPQAVTFTFSFIHRAHVKLCRSLARSAAHHPIYSETCIMLSIARFIRKKGRNFIYDTSLIIIVAVFIGILILCLVILSSACRCWCLGFLHFLSICSSSFFCFLNSWRFSHLMPVGGPRDAGYFFQVGRFRHVGRASFPVLGQSDE